MLQSISSSVLLSMRRLWWIMNGSVVTAIASQVKWRQFHLIDLRIALEQRWSSGPSRKTPGSTSLSSLLNKQTIHSFYWWLKHLAAGFLRKAQIGASRCRRMPGQAALCFTRTWSEVWEAGSHLWAHRSSPSWLQLQRWQHGADAAALAGGVHSASDQWIQAAAAVKLQRLEVASRKLWTCGLD